MPVLFLPWCYSAWERSFAKRTAIAIAETGWRVWPDESERAQFADGGSNFLHLHHAHMCVWIHETIALGEFVWCTKYWSHARDGGESTAWATGPTSGSSFSLLGCCCVHFEYYRRIIDWSNGWWLVEQLIVDLMNSLINWLTRLGPPSPQGASECSRERSCWVRPVQFTVEANGAHMHSLHIRPQHGAIDDRCMNIRVY